MGRRPCCEKVGLNRGGWTASEDQTLIGYIKAHGEGKWRDLPKRAGLKRCGKSCRLRWLNYLNPEIRRGNITPEEEDLIITLHKHLGNRWSLIAGRFPGRTDNEIKNYWNTILHKKVQGHHHAKRKPKKNSTNFTVPQAILPTEQTSPAQESSTEFVDVTIQNIINEQTSQGSEDALIDLGDNYLQFLLDFDVNSQHSSLFQENIQNTMDSQAPQWLHDMVADTGSGDNYMEDVDTYLEFLTNDDDPNTLNWDGGIYDHQDLSSDLCFSSDASLSDYWRQILEFGSFATLSESPQWP